MALPGTRSGLRPTHWGRMVAYSEVIVGPHLSEAVRYTLSPNPCHQLTPRSTPGKSGHPKPTHHPYFLVLTVYVVSTIDILSENLLASVGALFAPSEERHWREQHMRRLRFYRPPNTRNTIPDFPSYRSRQSSFVRSRRTPHLNPSLAQRLRRPPSPGASAPDTRNRHLPARGATVAIAAGIGGAVPSAAGNLPSGSKKVASAQEAFPPVAPRHGSPRSSRAQLHHLLSPRPRRHRGGIRPLAQSHRHRP